MGTHAFAFSVIASNQMEIDQQSFVSAIKVEILKFRKMKTNRYDKFRKAFEKLFQAEFLLSIYEILLPTLQLPPSQNDNHKHLPINKRANGKLILPTP